MNLLSSIEGFSAENRDEKKIKEFLHQLDLCWLYCSDEIIKKGYAFLGSVHREAKTTDEEKEKLVKNFVFAMRKDLISRRLVKKTKLSIGDYQLLRAVSLKEYKEKPIK